MTRSKVGRRARELWEGAEVRRLASPWTTATKFEGDVAEHFMALARTQQEPTDGQE